jgi:serine/threonine protein kinase
VAGGRQPLLDVSTDPNSVPEPTEGSALDSNVAMGNEGSKGGGASVAHANPDTAGAKELEKMLAQYRSSKLSLADFTLKRTLGTGSFGRVLLAQHKESKHWVAIKVLRKDKVVKMKQVEHTNYEKNILDVIRCPFIVNLLGSFQDAKNLYLVLEYVRGGEMFTHLRKASRFTDEVARFYAAEVVLAWEYIHTRNIVYRDLKPENLLINADGHLKVTDFGFAKKIEDRTWTVCGTPEYLAPEIILSRGYGKAVDYWALGILIYEMLVGYPPFYDDDPYEIYEKIVACKVRYPAHLKPAAKDLIGHLLQPDITKRYGDLKNGINDIKNHKWFTGIDWEALKQLKVDPPFVPVVTGGAGDDSNFQSYEEDPDLAPAPGATDPYEDKFKNW